MAILNILRYPDERLHTQAIAVAEVNDEIRTLIDDMPWRTVGTWTDDELSAIWLYLESLPALEDATP